MKLGSLFGKQTPLPFIGTFKQLIGGASTWITLAIFLFSGIAAWNTETMTEVRRVLPWLNFLAFTGIIVGGLVLAMWMEFKFIQPSIMVYWNNLHYSHGNPLLPKIEQLQKSNEEIVKKLADVDELLKKILKEQPNKGA